MKFSLGFVDHNMRFVMHAGTLVGMKEGSIGVLVSGPKTMREDVAPICSAAKADNLHFESISFTW